MCHEMNHSRYSIEFGRVARDRKSTIIDTVLKNAPPDGHIHKRSKTTCWQKERRPCPKNLNEKRDSDGIQRNPIYTLHAN